MSRHATTEVYQGALCKNGHDGTRYRKNSHCVECTSIRAKIQYNKRKLKNLENLTHTTKTDCTYQSAPCPSGHNGLRYNNNNACVECTKIRSKVWRDAHKVNYEDKEVEVDEVFAQIVRTVYKRNQRW